MYVIILFFLQLSVIRIYCVTIKTGDKLIFSLVKIDRLLQLHCWSHNKAHQASVLLLVELFPYSQMHH